MQVLNQREGQSFVMVTHDEVLAWRFQNVYRLVDGLLVRDNVGRVDLHQVP